ncbi:response regulator, partial [Acinetobacter baumannii]
LLTDILTGEGHEVVAAATAREALQLLRNRHFDAVFSDVGMPEMNGLELAQAIRAEDERISLALITGWGEAINEQER